MVGVRFLDLDFIAIKLPSLRLTGYLILFYCIVRENTSGVMQDGGPGQRWWCEPRGPGVRDAPRWGGRAKIENSSRRHPRKFGLKRFLAVRRSWRGSGVACFWATSLEKISAAWLRSSRSANVGWMQQSAVAE